MKIAFSLCAALLIISTCCAYASKPINTDSCAYQPNAPTTKDAEEYKESVQMAFESATTQCGEANAPEAVIEKYQKLSEKAACDTEKCPDLNKEYRALFNHQWCGYQDGISNESEKKDLTESAKQSIKKCKFGPEHDWLYSKLMACYHQQDDQCVILGDGIGSVYSPVYVESR
jgi:hypothetical protein